MDEKKEAWMRIIVLIVSGVILWAWKTLIQILLVINWLVTIFTGKRNRGLAGFSEIWNTQTYIFFRYITFVSNERPFPFKGLYKNLSSFQK